MGKKRVGRPCKKSYSRPKRIRKVKRRRRGRSMRYKRRK